MSLITMLDGCTKNEEEPIGRAIMNSRERTRKKTERSMTDARTDCKHISKI